MSALLTIERLHISYGDSSAVNDLSLRLPQGRCLGIVGESGSGKSQTGLAIMGLLPKAATVSGAIALNGHSLSGMERRGQVAMVFQDPQSAFTPHMRIGAQVAEAMDQPTPEGIEAALRRAGLPDPKRAASAYPHALSGGMRQRAMLAMALARKPKLIIADEPTTALDATVQMELLAEFATVKASGTAMILISHDIGVVAGLADEIMVMRSGKVVEHGQASDILERPNAPYTKALIAASVLKRGETIAPPSSATALIEARGLSKTYTLARPHLFAKKASLQALAATDVSLGAGETLAIVGESGSGKSTLAKLLLGLEAPTTGQVLWRGKDITGMPAGQLRRARKAVQPVFQDPFASFDPQRSLGKSIQDAINLHGTSEQLEDLLASVNLSPDIALKYPHEASGGQNQRAAIARALASTPDALICDEALSALDKTTQGQVLDVLAALKASRGLAMVFVSHDLDVVAAIADRILILKDGHVVESGSVDDIYLNTREPYTKRLIAAQTVPNIAAMRAKISAATARLGAR